VLSHALILKRPHPAALVLLSVLDDNLTTSVVTALRAYTVIHYRCSAVGASCQCGDGSEVVCTTLVSSLFGEFVFRMCHCSIF